MNKYGVFIDYIHMGYGCARRKTCPSANLSKGAKDNIQM
jgi:hypothetical protein